MRLAKAIATNHFIPANMPKCSQIFLSFGLSPFPLIGKKYFILSEKHSDLFVRCETSYSV